VNLVAAIDYKVTETDNYASQTLQKGNIKSHSRLKNGMMLQYFSRNGTIFGSIVLDGC
jgi:hypothetical protein